MDVVGRRREHDYKMERMLRKYESHRDGETCKNKRKVKYESPKRRMSRSILDRARLYRSPTKKFDSSSFSKSRRGARCNNIKNSECSLCKGHNCHKCVHNEDDDIPIPPWNFVIPDEDSEATIINIPTNVNMDSLKIPEHIKCVSVQKVNTLMTMIVGLHNVLVTKILESKERLNGYNNLIHQLRRRLISLH
ncbi:hypothetical protein CsatB_000473 [Cannabis sativa]